MEEEQKKSRGCVISIVIVIIIAVVILTAAIGFYIYKKNNNSGSDGGLNNDNTVMLERAATVNDLTITEEKLDFMSLGETLTFNPKCNIDNLQITFEFVKGNTILQKVVKNVGDVKKSSQYTVTIALTDLSWDVIKNSFNVQCRYYVSGGTTTVFN